MASYQVSSSSKLVVRARSSIHDTTTEWTRIEGHVTADPDALDSAPVEARFEVDMTAFDAGDFLKNRKLKKDFAIADNPRASFEVQAVRDVSRQPDGSFEATADGVLRWHGRQTSVSVRGRGTIDASGIDATGTFDLDITELGLQAPRFLMFKVENEVTVEVTLRASAR